MSIFIANRKILEEGDNDFHANLLLETETPNVIKGNGGIANVGQHNFPLSDSAKQWKKGQVFSASFEVTATEAGGMIYFGFNGNELWNSQMASNILQGTHRYKFIGVALQQDNDNADNIRITVDNSNATITVQKPMLIAGDFDASYVPALVEKSDFFKLLSYPEAQFDMNDVFLGIKPFNGTAPKNAPEGTAVWGLAASFPLVENDKGQGNTIQFIFDLTGLCMYRTLDGSSGKTVWNPWHKIGGALTRLYTKLCGTFTSLEVA